MPIATGRFTLAGIPPGDYELAVSGGTEKVSRKIALSARDRAVVSAALRHQDGGRWVEVTQMAQAGFGGGGVLGGIVGGVATGVPVAAPMMMRREFVAENAAFKALDGASTKKLEGAAAPRTRSYFPEALYINPEIITDGNGEASISIPLADSITTWRMA